MPGVTYAAADLHIGHANVYLHEGSSDVNLGALGSNISIQIMTSKANKTVGQLGPDTIVDRVISGGSAKVSFTLREITLTNLSRVSANAVVTGTTNKRLDWKVLTGLSLRAGAKLLKIVPLDGASETTDVNRIINIPFAIPDEDTVELILSATEQQEIKCSFTALPDPANGNSFMWCGAETPS